MTASLLNPDKERGMLGCNPAYWRICWVFVGYHALVEQWLDGSYSGGILTVES